MRYAYLLIIGILFLAACQQAAVTEDTEEQDLSDEEDDIETQDDHIGCPDGDIVDGECVPSGENTGLFEKDLSHIRTQEIDEGYFAEPAESGDYPGVIMIHEWWGLNDNIRYMARLLANEGYRVLAVDLYDGEVAETSERAGELASEVRSDPDKALSILRDAKDYLSDRTDKVASIGWCFGGGQTLNFAMNDNLDAAVIYYGHLTEIEEMDEPILGIFGEEDNGIPVDTVIRFDEQLDSTGVEHDINIYPGVGHAFANPSGSNFAPEETKDAWEKTLAFLGKQLKQAQDPVEEQEDEPVVIGVEAVDYDFIIDGEENPDIVVQQGQRVRIDFESTQGFHDFVSRFGASERVSTGGSTSFEFTADEKGEFAYWCSVGSHRAGGMEGKLIVE